MAGSPNADKNTGSALQKRMRNGPVLDSAWADGELDQVSFSIFAGLCGGRIFGQTASKILGG
jgi:hypothetical protein